MATGSVYYNNISFTGPTANVQRENKPLDLFNRLTKCGGVSMGGGTVDPLALSAPRSRRA